MFFCQRLYDLFYWKHILQYFHVSWVSTTHIGVDIQLRLILENKLLTFDQKKKTIPLYVGLTTGFCGSFTSFSTFITDAFLALDNNLAPASATSLYHTTSADAILPRPRGFSFMALLAVLIIHPAVSIHVILRGVSWFFFFLKFSPLQIYFSCIRNIYISRLYFCLFLSFTLKKFMSKYGINCIKIWILSVIIL